MLEGGFVFGLILIYTLRFDYLCCVMESMFLPSCNVVGMSSSLRLPNGTYTVREPNNLLQLLASSILLKTPN